MLGLFGKDPQPVVVSFLSGEDSLALQMAVELRRQFPNEPLYVVGFFPREIPDTTMVLVPPTFTTWQLYWRLLQRFRRLRIRRSAVLFTGDPAYNALRWAALLLAPWKTVLYNAKLRRHVVRLRDPIAAWRFLRDVPADRFVLRPGRQADLDDIARIQAVSLGTSSWDPRSYLACDLLVAELDGRLSGFLVSRTVGPGEVEILNVAVAPESRRRGVGTALLKAALSRNARSLYLEVRQSNTDARRLYERLGFTQVGVRPRYYNNPQEDGIVMRFQSC